MSISAEGILEATFDPEWASVGLIVDGGMWPSPVATIRIVRRIAGEADMVVRGVDRVTAVGGYWIGSDIEMPLGAPVSYIVDGYGPTGALVASAHVTVTTDGAGRGVWLKAAGQPNATVRLGLVEVGSITSETQGGVYDIVGGTGVAVGAAGGLNAERFSITVRAMTTSELDAALRTLATRILLIQPLARVRPFPSGWYFVESVSRTRANQVDGDETVDLALSVVRTGMPAGVGQGIAGVSWGSVMGTYGDWEQVTDDVATWFALGRGA